MLMITQILVKDVLIELGGGVVQADHVRENEKYANAGVR